MRGETSQVEEGRKGGREEGRQGGREEGRKGGRTGVWEAWGNSVTIKSWFDSFFLHRYYFSDSFFLCHS